jgi:hypothetical protein
LWKNEIWLKSDLACTLPPLYWYKRGEGGSAETPLQVIREWLYIPNHASARDIDRNLAIAPLFVGILARYDSSVPRYSASILLGGL